MTEGAKKDWAHNIKYGAMVLTAIILAILIWQALQLARINETLRATNATLQQTNTKLDALDKSVHSADNLFKAL